MDARDVANDLVSDDQQPISPLLRVHPAVYRRPVSHTNMSGPAAIVGKPFIDFDVTNMADKSEGKPVVILQRTFRLYAMA